MFPSSLSPLGRRQRLLILAILVLAVVLRLFYLNEYSTTKIFPVLAYSDSYCYYTWAKDIASGEILGNTVFMKWPFYAYFLSFFLALSRDNILLIFILQFLLGVANCLAVYLIARRIFNAPVALLSSLLCLSYGLFLFYEGLLLYTSLSLFLNSCLFLFFLRLRDSPSNKNLFWVGFFLGICVITQAAILLFGILAAIWILWQVRTAWHVSAKRLVFFLLGLFSVIGMVTLRNYLVGKDFVIISGNPAINFYIGNNPDATGTFSTPKEITLNQEDMFRDAQIIARQSSGKELKASGVSHFWIQKAMGFISRDPLHYLKLYFKKIVFLFSPREFVHDIEYYFIAEKIRLFKFIFPDLRLIIPLAILGMFLGVRGFKDTALLYFALLSMAAVISLFFVASRYRIALVPFLVIFGAFGLFEIYQALVSKSYLKFTLLCLALAAIFTTLNYNKIAGLNAPTLPRAEEELNYHLTEAAEYENGRDYKRAIHELNLAQAIDPDNRRTIFRLGVIHSLENDYELAGAEFREVIRGCSYCVDAYYNLGYIYNRQKHFQQALRMLKTALSLDPESLCVHYELGVAYKSTDDLAKAKNEFEYVLKHLKQWRKLDREITENELKGLTK